MKKKKSQKLPWVKSYESFCDLWWRHFCTTYQNPLQFPILSIQISKYKIHNFCHSFAARNLKLCTWTNLWVENSFPGLVFRILKNLTTCCDVFSPKFKQKRAKHVFLHKMMLGNNRKAKTCTWSNFVVDNSFPVLVFIILENFTTCCDVIYPKFRQ